MTLAPPVATSSTAPTNSSTRPSPMQFSSLAIPTAASQSLAQSASISQSSTWKPATVVRMNASLRKPTAELWISSPMSIWLIQSTLAVTWQNAVSLVSAHT